MRRLASSVFALVFILSLSAQALSFRGFVFTSEGQYFFTDVETKKSYLLKATNDETAYALSKLGNFDTLTGNGNFGPANTILLESVDFVALRRLIGFWRGPSAVVNFVDYSRVNFHMPRNNQSSAYTYALAPADGDNWRIFFTDNSSVALGSLMINGSKAQIEVYDSDTGEVSQQYNLERINP